MLGSSELHLQQFHQILHYKGRQDLRHRIVGNVKTSSRHKLITLDVKPVSVMTVLFVELKENIILCCKCRGILAIYAPPVAADISTHSD